LTGSLIKKFRKLLKISQKINEKLENSKKILFEIYLSTFSLTKLLIGKLQELEANCT